MLGSVTVERNGLVTWIVEYAETVSRIDILILNRFIALFNLCDLQSFREQYILQGRGRGSRKDQICVV